MSNTYLLDTNIISYLTDSKSPYRNSVKEKLFSLSEEDKVAVSIVTLYELLVLLKFQILIFRYF